MSQPTDFDSPWKDALENYLPEFLAFFFPDIYAEIDWSRDYIFLDKELEQQFWQTLHAYEEAQKMPYISSVERIGIQKGLQQGRREELLAGIELALDLKFGNAGLSLLPEIQSITDIALLQAVRGQIKAAATPEELRQVYAGAGDTPTEG